MLNDVPCFKAVYIVCGYTDLRSGIYATVTHVSFLKGCSWKGEIPESVP